MSPVRKKPVRIDPGPGQESVWDYPRPPRVEVVRERLRVVLGGVTIADTTAGIRVLETSHPPNYYFPRADIRSDALVPETGSSWCEWKGQAHYYTVQGGDRAEPSAAWGYAHPNSAFDRLSGMVAFYPGRMDACFVDEERVIAQPGGFYGGWITSRVVGPFKGTPGTNWW
jgi:uncharacterized protein (DUF427 family)